MNTIYDNRISSASVNTLFALDADADNSHSSEMDSEAEIRAALQAKLSAREITQNDIAAALKIQQPNVAKLFQPAKNGKLRKISFDEGLRLIDHFDLDPNPSRTTGEIRVSEALLARLLHELSPSFPKTEAAGSAAQPLAAALSHALELLQQSGATDPTDREVAMAARAAASRFAGGDAA